MVYRYDFPSIDTYTDFVGVNSITNIVKNTFGFTQVIDVISYTEITGDVVVAGDLTAENLIVGSTNVITEINTKQDLISDGDLSISKTDGLQTALDEKQDLISDDDLTISNTLNLQTTLNNLDSNIIENTSDITTLNKNNIIYNSKEYPI